MADERGGLLLYQSEGASDHRIFEHVDADGVTTGTGTIGSQESSAWEGIARAFDPSRGAWETLANGAVPEGSCRMPRVGPGPQWLAGGGPLLTSAQPDATLLAPRCDALPEPDVAVWAGDELIMWGGPDEGYGGNTAVGLRWRPPAP